MKRLAIAFTFLCFFVSTCLAWTWNGATVSGVNGGNLSHWNGAAISGGGGPTLSYVATGTVAGGATPAAITPGFPSGIQAGDLLVLAVENKYPTNSPSTPSGWTLASNCQGSGGASTAAADSGTVYSTVFYKKAIGDETGTQTVTITSANSSRGAIVAYRPTSGYEVLPVCTNGSYSHTATTAWSVTGASDPGFITGDWAVVVSGNNSDLAASFSAEAMTATGYTFGTMTERVDSIETQGNDSSLVVADFAAGTGTSSAAPVYTMTGATNGTNTPAGASVIVRLRPTEDTTAPTMSASLPSGTVACPADPTAVTIGVTTNEAANCKWDTSDVAYASMANTYSTGQGAGVHTTSVGTLACEATATYYTRCADLIGNASSSSNTHNVTMAAYSTAAAPNLLWDGDNGGGVLVGELKSGTITGYLEESPTIVSGSTDPGTASPNGGNVLRVQTGVGRSYTVDSTATCNIQDGYYSVQLYISAGSYADTTIAQIWSTGDSDYNRILIDGTGHVTIENNSTSYSFSSTSTVPLNQWVTVEVRYSVADVGVRINNGSWESSTGFDTTATGCSFTRTGSDGAYSGMLIYHDNSSFWSTYDQQ